MAGVAGLEPVTSAVTGQRSNQLSYTPASGIGNLVKLFPHVNVQPKEKTIRAADAKEVGVGNPAEETYRYPNQIRPILVNCLKLSTLNTTPKKCAGMVPANQHFPCDGILFRER